MVPAGESPLPYIQGALVIKLDLKLIESQLTTKVFGKQISFANELWDSIDSTNTRAKELAAQGAPEGVMVVARQQTTGRGRQGHNWFSPVDSGIYVSFLLRPQVSREILPLYTLACGVACARAIEEIAGITIGLKWVNDLIYDQRKLGGILTEIPGNAMSADKPPALIIGIGLNLKLPSSEVPQELQGKIVFLEDACSNVVDPNLLLAQITFHLEKMYLLLQAGKSPEIIESWKHYSVTLGQQVRASINGIPYEGLAEDLSTDGGLILLVNEKRMVLRAGAVSICSTDGSYV